MKEAICVIAMAVVYSACIAQAAITTESGEKAVLAEMRQAIPADRIKNVDDLHEKWQEVENGKSKALIIDLRTEAEFASGHIKDSNNIDSGHAYTMPKKWQDPATEMWVLCRTSHRAIYFTGLLYKYGYTNVYLVDEGIVGWLEKGYPLVNAHLGEIRVVKYDKGLKETYEFRENR